MEFLLARKANINQERNIAENNPLLWVADNGTTQALEYLLERGADTAAQDRFGRSATDFALHGGFQERVELCQKARKFELSTSNEHGVSDGPLASPDD